VIDFQDDQPFQGRRGQGGQGANSFIAKYCVNCLKDRFDYPDEDTKPDSFVCPQCKGLHIQKKGGHRANVEPRPTSAPIPKCYSSQHPSLINNAPTIVGAKEQKFGEIDAVVVAEEEVPVMSHTRARKVAARPAGFVDSTDKSISFAMSQHDKNGHNVLGTKNVHQPKRAAQRTPWEPAATATAGPLSSSSSSLAIGYDAQMLRHAPAVPGHPERPDRVSAAWQHLVSSGLTVRLWCRNAPCAHSHLRTVGQYCCRRAPNGSAAEPQPTRSWCWHTQRRISRRRDRTGSPLPSALETGP
jgi:hypothetical protein